LILKEKDFALFANFEVLRLSAVKRSFYDFIFINCFIIFFGLFFMASQKVKSYRKGAKCAK